MLARFESFFTLDPWMAARFIFLPYTRDFVYTQKSIEYSKSLPPPLSLSLSLSLFLELILRITLITSEVTAY